jgi:hypothetical protein
MSPRSLVRGTSATIAIGLIAALGLAGAFGAAGEAGGCLHAHSPARAERRAPS